MAENPGKYPLDPTSKVGQVRVTLGDTASEPFDPPRPGEQNYGMYSDLEIEAFLAQAEDSVEGSLYLIYMQMAGAAARESRSVKDLDLQVDLTKRATDLRLIAAEWKSAWDSATGDIFELFDTVVHRCRHELAEGVSCWRGCNGSGLF